MSIEENLQRERAKRASAYLSAVAARDKLAPGSADYRFADNRVGVARYHLEQWREPIPGAHATPTPAPPPPVATSRPEISKSTAPAALNPSPASAVDPVEREAREILNSDKSASERGPLTEVDRLAIEIASADLGDEDEAETMVREILEA